MSCFVCSTGQHDVMLRQALSAFDLSPDIELAVMEPGQGLGQLTSRLFAALDRMLADEHPDWVVVQGDTTSAYVAAVVAFYRMAMVAHVEAGLRTHDRHAPFPEEVNRRSITVVADLHFAPTEGAADNLRREGVAPSAIRVTGNTAVDAVLWARRRLAGSPPPSLPGQLSEVLVGRRLVLVTGHRRESFGPGLRSICQAVRDLADRFDDIVVVYPVHLNPEVRRHTDEVLGGHRRVVLLEPLEYLTMVWLLERSHLILTDSGGIQEEAPSLAKPLLILRTSTERPEAIEAGGAVLVGADRERIVATASRLLASDAAYDSLRPRWNPFGDGKAGVRIVDALARHTFRA